MRRSHSPGASALVLAVLLPGLAATAKADGPVELRLATGASTLGFKAKTTFHDFEEKAAKVTGTLSLLNGRPTRGQVSCPVVELKSDEAARDKTMWGKDYLNSAMFGTIDFTFESLDGPAVPTDSDAIGTVHGLLHVRDRSLPVAALVTYRSKAGGVEMTGTFPLDIRTVGLVPPVVAVVQRMDPTIVIVFKLAFAPVSAAAGAK